MLLKIKNIRRKDMAVQIIGDATRVKSPSGDKEFDVVPAMVGKSLINVYYPCDDDNSHSGQAIIDKSTKGFLDV